MLPLRSGAFSLSRDRISRGKARIESAHSKRGLRRRREEAGLFRVLFEKLQREGVVALLVERETLDRSRREGVVQAVHTEAVPEREGEGRADVDAVGGALLLARQGGGGVGLSPWPRASHRITR